MPITYRLLRDNKQTGPYSLEELLQQSLEPFDLVWVDDKSVGWRYPAEIESLKPYLQETTTEKQQPEQTHPASHATREFANQAPIEPLNFVQTDMVTEEEITAEKLEKKANEIYLRVQAYTQQKELKQKDLQTNFGRSLSDLKQEYADWLHQQRRRKKVNISKKYAFTGLAVVLLVSVGYFLIVRNRTVQQLPLHENYYLSNAAEKPGDYSKKKSSEKKTGTEVSAASKAPVRKALTVDQFIDSVRRELAKQDKKLQSLYIQKTSVRTILADRSSQRVREQKPEKENATNTAEPIGMDAKYVLGAGSEYISSVEVTIRNNGPEPLKTVAVEVLYYKHGKRPVGKQTLYFKNIQPGNSFTLSSLPNRKAFSARFKIDDHTN